MAKLHRRGSSGSRVAQAPIPAERRRVLAEWNDTAREVPEATLPELFEAAGRPHPGAPPAVITAGASLTYGELNARANRLARYLASLGAGPERLVAVAMERSAEVFVAWLAVPSRARPSCRSTRRIRPSGSASCWPTPGPIWWSRRSAAAAARCPRRRAAARAGRPACCRGAAGRARDPGPADGPARLASIRPT